MSETVNVDAGLSRSLGWLRRAQWNGGPRKGLLPRATVPGRRLGPYPEITGYCLSLFLKVFLFFKDKEYVRMAKMSRDALLGLQLRNGGFCHSVGGHQVITFDHVAITNGLLDYCKLAKDASCESSAMNAIDYIVGIQRQDGSIPIASFDYTRLYSHFYLGKAMIPLVKAYELTKDEKYIGISKSIANFLVRRFLDGKFFVLSDKKATSGELKFWNRFHYLCYAVEGLIALEEYHPPLRTLIYEIGTYLLESQARNGATPFSFGTEGTVVGNSVDLAATAQVARILLHVYCKTLEKKYLRGVERALSYLITRQHISRFKMLDGGIPFGYHLYDRFTACSWATQFTIDAMLMWHHRADSSCSLCRSWF